jgi:hypothetical protein
MIVHRRKANAAFARVHGTLLALTWDNRAEIFGASPAATR